MKGEKIVVSWEECPTLMSVEDVSNAFGLSKKRVRVWFNDKTFPVIKDGIRKVDKDNLRKYLFCQ